MTSKPELKMNQSALITIQWIAMLAIAWSGGVHLVIVPVEFSHSVAHGSFFLLVGLAQIGWAVAIWRFPAQAWCFVGLALSGGMVILWALTQLVYTPYAPSANPVDIWLIMSKMAEINGFVALVGYLVISTRDDSPESAKSWTVVGAVTLAIGFGIMLWGAGRFAEAAAPSFGRSVQKEGSLPDSHLDQPSLKGGFADNSGSDPADHPESDSADAQLHRPAKEPGENTEFNVESAPNN